MRDEIELAALLLPHLLVPLGLVPQAGFDLDLVRLVSQVVEAVGGRHNCVLKEGESGLDRLRRANPVWTG
jgi:hypothetical protein